MTNVRTASRSMHGCSRTSLTVAGRDGPRSGQGRPDWVVEGGGAAVLATASSGRRPHRRPATPRWRPGHPGERGHAAGWRNLSASISVASSRRSLPPVDLDQLSGTHRLGVLTLAAEVAALTGSPRHGSSWGFAADPKGILQQQYRLSWPAHQGWQWVPARPADRGGLSIEAPPRCRVQIARCQAGPTPVVAAR